MDNRQGQSRSTTVLLEDFLHSFTVTGMGFAFSFGVMSIIAQKLLMKNKRIAVELVAVIVVTIIPLMMLVVSESAGLMQRLMFLVAYSWYIFSAQIDLNKSLTE